MEIERQIFLVDDDASIRKAMRRFLNSVGFEVRAFPSAEEFLDFISPQITGCLILDVRLPGLSGLELQGRLRDMGIADISTPENNVHAGVKYLRWVMDRYFSEGDINDDDRVRFALAAYNAGPANIRRSRASTTQLGYDASRWFNHSELGTMQRVGIEPVHYVRNINKYYLSFRMSLALSEMKKEIR